MHSLWLAVCTFDTLRNDQQMLTNRIKIAMCKLINDSIRPSLFLHPSTVSTGREDGGIRGKERLFTNTLSL